MIAGIPLNIYYASLLAMASFLFLWLWAVRLNRKMKESWCLFNQLSKKMQLPSDDVRVLRFILRKIHCLYPHAILCSDNYFNNYFQRAISVVDRSRPLFRLKNDLLRLYPFIKDKISLKNNFQPGMRTMPRFRSNEPVFIRQNKSNIEKGNLINISGGGICVKTHTPIKNKRLDIGWDHACRHMISAKVVETKQDEESYFIRARFALIYPKN